MSPTKERLFNRLKQAVLLRDGQRALQLMSVGKRPPSLETVSMPVLEEGTLLHATDRDYVVTSRGWRRVNRPPGTPHLRPAQSQIRLLPKLDKKKYNPVVEANRHEDMRATLEGLMQ